MCISDANLPELALKDHLKKEVIRQSSFKTASQGRIAAWVLDTAGFEQCNKSRVLSSSSSSIHFCILYFAHFVVPMEISPMGNLGYFPQGKPAATESCYPTLINYKVHAGSFRVSKSRREAGDF